MEVLSFKSWDISISFIQTPIYAVEGFLHNWLMKYYIKFKLWFAKFEICICLRMLVSDDGSKNKKVNLIIQRFIKVWFFLLRWVRTMTTGAVGYSLMAKLWCMMDKKKLE